jgi:hypothetical protein
VSQVSEPTVSFQYFHGPRQRGLALLIGNTIIDLMATPTCGGGTATPNAETAGGKVVCGSGSGNLAFLEVRAPIWIH